DLLAQPRALRREARRVLAQPRALRRGARRVLAQPRALRREARRVLAQPRDLRAGLLLCALRGRGLRLGRREARARVVRGGRARAERQDLLLELGAAALLAPPGHDVAHPPR